MTPSCRLSSLLVSIQHSRPCKPSCKMGNVFSLSAPPRGQRVPLMWSAAEGNRGCAVLEWLIAKAQQAPSLRVAGEEVTGREAALMGWEALHDAMRSQGTTSREDLSEWIHNQGFPRPRWGAHFSGRAQERILNLTVSQDARGSAIEALFVHIVLHRCRSVHHVPINPELQRGVQCPQRQETNWEVLDRFDLHEVFE